MENSSTEPPFLKDLQFDLEQIELSDIERQRIAQQFSALQTSIAPVQKRRPSSRHRMVIGIAVLTTAFCAVLALAFIPARLDHGSVHRIIPQTAAAEALTNAGQRAADLPWQPLAVGQFQYVHVQSYMPANYLSADPTMRPVANSTWTLANEHELWLGHDESARVVSVDVQPFGISGRPSTIAVNGHRLTIPVPRDASSYRTQTWAAHGAGYRSTYNVYFNGRGHEVDDISAPANASYAGPYKLMYEWWGTTVEEIARLPASGRTLKQGIALLISTAALRSPEVQQPLHQANNESRASIVQSVRIRVAIRMLAAAPLSPAARRDVFAYLAQVPGARLDGQLLDRRGRTGTAITFSSNFDRTYAPYDITDRQVLASIRKQGGNWTDVKTTGQVFHVRKHRQINTWSTTIIFDPRTSQLLQTSSRGRQVLTAEPTIGTVQRDGFRHIYYHPADGGVSGGQDVQVYVSSGRTTNTVSQIAFCTSNPSIC